MDYGLTQQELDRALIPVGMTEPLTELELRAVCKTLLHRYEDPTCPDINAAYLQEAFSAGLNGAPDATKVGFHRKAEGSEAVKKFEPKTWEAYERKSLDLRANGRAFGGGIEKDALDTTMTDGVGGGSLINQAVVPTLSVWFNTEAKLFRRLPTVEANGLVYEWENLFALSNESTEGFLDENGCPIEANGVYFRGRAPISLIGLSRRINLKLELAVRAGGVLYNGGLGPYELEMMNLFILRSQIAQRALLHGTTIAAHTGADEFGQTFADGFPGMRVLTSFNANTEIAGLYPAGTTPIIKEAATTGNFPLTNAIRSAITEIKQTGGRPSAVWMSYSMGDRIALEHSPFTTYVPPLGATPGTITAGWVVDSINTPDGPVPIIMVPDSHMGSYPANTIGTPTINGIQAPATSLTGTVQDIYVVSESDLARTYLGTPEPQPIELQMGYSDLNGLNCFSRKFHVYMFIGFAMRVPIHQAKVRVKIA